MKMPWEQDKEWNNTVITNATENSWGVIAKEGEWNYKIQTEQDVLIEELLNRVTSLEEDMEFMRKHIRILDGIIF